MAVARREVCTVPGGRVAAIASASAPVPLRSEVKMAGFRLPSRVFCSLRAMAAAIREPCSRSISTKGFMTARTLSWRTSPPKTPPSNGAPIKVSTSSPKCRSTKLATDSSCSGAERFSSSARESSAAYAARQASVNSGVCSSDCRLDGTIMRMPSGIGCSLPWCRT